ncbi:MAG: 2-oxoglutarate ferredoxin oxidoreductase subunit gamma [Dethiosulfovibrio peptidovorans]|nr:MAG: 2-oxoglutarate ferredoxin oxidoreductase subunit gamma [Dethiosulfovibrio peptidovorans]
MNDRFEIRFAGSGGQGVILASVVVGEAASLYADDLYAVQTQSYGPEARGGSSKAEVVISGEPIDYPMPVQPDLQVILTTQACEKYATNTKPGGRLIVDDFYVQDIPQVDANIYHLPIVRTARDVIGRELVTNMVSLGMVARVMELEKVLDPAAVRKAVLARVPKGTEEMNGKAFDEGYRILKNSQSIHM